MRAQAKSPEDLYRNQERTLRLAELLFNLQLVEGIDGRLGDLRAGKIEPTYAELEAGAFLLRAGASFKYVEERGIRGLDYDGEVSLDTGVRVNCEMKCKVESTEASDGAIRNALGTARKQLPPNEPGLVFLKVPESWTIDPKVDVTVAATIGEFLRGTSRVVGVILRWEQLVLPPDGRGAAIVYRFRVERGVPPKEVPASVGAFLEQLTLPKTVAWVRFRAIAEEAVADAI